MNVMNAHKKYLRTARKTIARLALSTSTIAVVLSVLAPVNALAATFTMQLGTADNFDISDGDEEPTYQRPESLERFYKILEPYCSKGQPRCDLRKFDETTWNRNFLHSFDLSTPLAYGEIVSATFESKFKVKGTNDSIKFGNFVLDSSDLWGGRVLFSHFGASIYEAIDVKLDLGELTARSGSSILSIMNEVGFLDFSIEDDTMVDYIKLTVETEAVPEPTSILALLTAGALGATSVKRKQKEDK